LYLGEGHAFMETVARAVEVGHNEGVLPKRPSVLNLQSDRDHPTQSLSDLAHLTSHFGSLKNLRGKRLVMSWAYSPSYGKPLSVAQGVCGLMTRLGMDVVLAYPDGYGLIPELERQFFKQAKESGGRFSVVHDMKEAFRNADSVYPKSWAPFSVMEEGTRMLRKGDREALVKLEKKGLAMNDKHKDWECTDAMMRSTKGGKALYMHCLPADVSGVSCKEGEVEKSVFERYRKELFLQAGHKPFIIAAMMMLTRFENPAFVLKRTLKGRTF
ncbi:MAG: knotted carbamoyltransferase YgeW, partial [Candidatus Chisholmbacteria bacterium RIFCSPHIGHO2_12_FULL_49_9]